MDLEHHDLHDPGDQEVQGDLDDLPQDDELSIASEREVEVGFRVGPIGQAQDQEASPQARVEPDTEPGADDGEEGARDPGGHGSSSHQPLQDASASLTTRCTSSLHCQAFSLILIL